MQELLFNFMSMITATPLPLTVTITIIVVAAVMLFFLIKLFSSRWRERYQIKRVLRRLGTQLLTNVILPDGMDGTIFVDYVVLTPKGLLALTVRRYDGLIYGADNIPQWTQVVNQKSFSFANPLEQAVLSRLAIRSMVPDMPVQSKVLFIGSQFPKDKPQDVITLQDVRQWSKVLEPVSEELQAAWQKFKQLQHGQQQQTATA